MFRIRRLYDTNSAQNSLAVEDVTAILKDQFPALHHTEFEKIPLILADPIKYKFHAILFVADNMKGQISGFALLLHASDLNFSFLDFISAAKYQTGRGVGGALYEKVRDESRLLKVKGLFYECLPDDPKLCKDPDVLHQNQARLRFYEKYGARPIINTKYETPVNPGDDNPPYLVLDTLGRENQLTSVELRKIVQAILKRKYSDLCDANYTKMVLSSIRDNPIRLRDFRYARTRKKEREPVVPEDQKIVLTFNNKHKIHHVQERGYVESPVRVETILSAISQTGIFRQVRSRVFADRYIEEVHNRRFLAFLKSICMKIPDNKPLYPYVFPIRNKTRPPDELTMCAGYYCIDTFTPLNKSSYLAARNAVNAALSAAQAILEGNRLAYALIRPPGHHAETDVFGGFCYFNSASIAAQYLSKAGKVAILDIDYHHGNGHQEIFYKRSDVLTVSIHGHPSFAYPFFSGFAEEKGEGEGLGFNLNMPLAEHIAPQNYLEAVKSAIRRINRFKPEYVVVALGFDTAKGDPTGTWMLDADAFFELGRLVGGIPKDILFVQEGGYLTKTIGKNARRFFQGVWEGAYKNE